MAVPEYIEQAKESGMEKLLKHTSVGTVGPQLAWAVKMPDGTLIADTSFATGKEAGYIIMGYPSDKEFEWNLANGWEIYQVKICKN